jgi:hypothetical protein
VNISQELIDMDIIRISNDIPKNWSSSICVGATCFPSFTDSVRESIEPGDTLHFKLSFNTDSTPGSGEAVVLFSQNGTTFADSSLFTVTTTNTGITDRDDNVTRTFALHGNFPNPFNPVTTIQYTVVETQNYASLPDVHLTIHNILGEKIETLVSETQPSGRYTVKWDAREYASGIYYYRLSVISNGHMTFTKTRRMLLIR